MNEPVRCARRGHSATTSLAAEKTGKGLKTRTRTRALAQALRMRCGVLALCLLLLAALSPAYATGTGYIGLLRTRDLTPFGYLRLDMRPAHAISAEPGAWGIETELAYQNTWALSPKVEEYFGTLKGRRELGPADFAAIRALPGENYLVDLELAQLDLTLHYTFTSRMGGYLVISGASYTGGFLDAAVEDFHDAFGFSNFGRPAARRNDFNILLDLHSTRSAMFEAPTDGGLLDPNIGIRYSGIAVPRKWNLVLEAALKLPLQGRRELLSSGRVDFGVQASLQRFFDHHAWYVNASGVYYDGSLDMPRVGPQVVPTLVVGYERRLTDATHVVLQGYASPSLYSPRETQLGELLSSKYQLSAGVYHRRGRGLITFAVTENLQNLNNTPDVGLLLGWSFSPALLPDKGAARP